MLISPLDPLCEAWLWIDARRDELLTVIEAALAQAGLVFLSGGVILAGGVALVLEQGLQGQAGQASVWGLLAVLAATAAWGIDNTLSRALAERDPAQVVVL